MGRSRDLAELATAYDVGGALGARNRIINGDMRIDQRNAGASVTPSANTYLVDRWVCGLAAGSKLTFEQSSTAPAGFAKSIKVTTASAYSVGASEAFLLRQFIEGLNVADLNWGTADAQNVTLSFWARSSITGTHGGSIKNSAADRSFPFTYTISAADTWEHKTVQVDGDTSGTWLGTTGIGMGVGFSLGAGSSASNTAGAWASGNYSSATGAVSLVGTNAATLYITGVQLEAGDVATPFERRHYGLELSLCQRYYWNPSMTIGFTVGPAVSTGSVVRMPVTMRTTPVLGSAAVFEVSSGNIGTPVIGVNTAQTATADGVFIINTLANWTTGVSVHLGSAGFSAEL